MSKSRSKRKPNPKAAVTARSRGNRPPISPVEFYGGVGIFVSLAVALLLHERYHTDWWVAWLISVNSITFLLFGYDKYLAELGKHRIPESVLLLQSALGGSGGGIMGMWLLWHKVRKTSFQRTFWIVVVFQSLGLGIWYFVIR